MYYNDWESLTNAVQQKCSAILEKDVLPVVEEILLDHILNDIYNAYTPKNNGWVNHETYKRRYSLLNKRNLYHELQYGGDTLFVTSWANPSAPIDGSQFDNNQPGAFLSMLEGKSDKSNPFGLWYGGFPRPAVTNAQNEVDRALLSNGSELSRVIRNALNS